MPASEPLDILIAGIVAVWTGHATLNAAVPLRGRQKRISSTQANPASAGHFPYAVIAGEPQVEKFKQTCSGNYWRTRIRFRVYGVSFAALSTPAAAVTDVFASQTFTLALAAGSLLRNEFVSARDVQESEGTVYKELSYDFETYLPHVA